MAFKQKQKEEQKALEAMKAKAAGKGPLSKCKNWLDPNHFWQSGMSEHKIRVVLYLSHVETAGWQNS